MRCLLTPDQTVSCAPAGLNWYLNSYAKIQFNYIRADLTNSAFGNSVANIYGLRAQFDF